MMFPVSHRSLSFEIILFKSIFGWHYISLPLISQQTIRFTYLFVLRLFFGHWVQIDEGGVSLLNVFLLTTTFLVFRVVSDTELWMSEYRHMQLLTWKVYSKYWFPFIHSYIGLVLFHLCCWRRGHWATSSDPYITFWVKNMNCSLMVC